MTENAVGQQRAQVVAVRDSKDPDGPKLFVSASGWQDLLERIKAGQLELPDSTRELLEERLT